MWSDKRAIDLLEIEHPLIQAPMAGPTNPQLVAAVCEAGGLGGLGAAGKSPDDLRVAIVLCSATTVNEAILLEELGVDVIIAQSAEAGGHRGTFQGDYRQALIGTVALVPRIVDAVSVPVIAAGGIMDSRGIVACLALGASAVQMGTAFLGSPEATVAPVWCNALEEAEAESTVVTEVFSGKPARGLHNRYIEELEAIDEPLLPYPAQFAVSRELRKEAARRGEASFVAMWAGQGVGLFRRQPAADLVKQLVTDSQQLINRLAKG